MSDEKPLQCRKLKESKVGDPSAPICIVHYAHSTDHEVKPLYENSFNKIKDAQKVRQAQMQDSSRLDEICRKIPENFEPEVHGSHKWCYKNFTHVYRLKKRCIDEVTPELDHDASSAQPSTCSLRSTSPPRFSGGGGLPMHQNCQVQSFFRTRSVFSVVRTESTSRQE